MSIVFKLTNAGRAALVNPPNTGTDPRTVVSLGVSATHTVIDPTLLTLPGEIKRIAQLAGGVVAADMIHVTARDSGEDSYTVRTLGLYLDDGTLLGAYSQAEPIIEKAGSSIMLLSTDILFLDGSLDLSNLIFGDTNFDNPPATTDRQGVVELATDLETSTGSDSTRAVTPAGLKPLLGAKVDKATSLNAGAGLTGGGDLSGSRTVAMGVPSNITSASANTVSEATHTHALDNTGVAAGSYGGAAAIPTFTVDAKGRVTQAGSVALTWGNLGGKPTTVAASGLTDAMATSWTMTAGAGLTGGGSGSANRTITLGAPSSITSASANTVSAVTHTHALDNTGVVAGSYGGSAAIPTFTVDDKGRVTQAGSVALTWGNMGGKPTTLAGFGISDAAPSAHVGATGPAHGSATVAVAGFMSAQDKNKLDGIAEGAQPNAVSSVAGRTGAVVLSKVDVGLSNVENTKDANKSVAFAAHVATLPAGAVGFFAMRSAPTGWLKANGAAVSIATYANLDAAIYVGDAENATAACGYRCTNPANPGGTRNTSGSYIVLPDMRGDFIRGWDDGRGVDAGRKLCSWQDDELESHAHASGSEALYADYGGGSFVNGSRTLATGSLPAYRNALTSIVGGNETRPRNVALLACIRY